MEDKRLHPEVSDASEVLHLKLWEGTVFDYSLSGFDGTATNGPVPVYPGFDFVAASLMYIDVGTGPTGVMTSSLWVKLDDVAGTEALFRLKATDRVTTELGVVTLAGFAGGTTILYVDGVVGTFGVTTITAGNWHYIAITNTIAIDATGLRVARTGTQYSDSVISDFRLTSILSSD